MNEKNGRTRVLFLCTGNSCRSQMAEGWARQLKGELIEPYSAGIETHGLNASAVKVMQEALGHYRRVRDEIRLFIKSLPEALYEKTR